jgi:hypothetical protein
VDRFRGSGNSILVATDGFARGMDFDDVRTVIHYQLPHSTDVGVVVVLFLEPTLLSDICAMRDQENLLEFFKFPFSFP